MQILINKELTEISDNVFAKFAFDKITVALPERLYCKDDAKIMNVLLLCLPKIYSDFLKELGKDFYNNNSELIKQDGISYMAIVFKNQTCNQKIFVLPIKDPDKGVYAFETWIKNKSEVINE